MTRKSETLCILPWISLSIGTLGQVLRCQMSREKMGHLALGDLNKIYDNEKYLALRSTMRRGDWDLPRGGDLPGCSPCKIRESDGVRSKRMQWKEEKMVADLWSETTFDSLAGNSIYHLDLAFNNKCNFRCRMCNSAFSSRWYADEKSLRERGVKVVDRIGRDQSDAEFNILDQLKTLLPRIKTLRRLEVVGGEPFLVPEFIKFLEILRQEGIQPGCEIMITTNGSLITPEYLEKIVGFKRVVMNISADATGELFEYLRSSGACSWSRFTNLLEMTRDFADRQNFDSPGRVWKINLNGAFQTYNMLNVGEFFEWIFAFFDFDRKIPGKASRDRHSFEHRLLYFPQHLSAKHAPEALKRESLLQLEEVEARHPWVKEIWENRFFTDIKSVLRSPTAANSMSLQSEFWRYTEALDEIRSEQDVSVLRSLAPYYESLSHET